MGMLVLWIEIMLESEYHAPIPLAPSFGSARYEVGDVVMVPTDDVNYGQRIIRLIKQ